MAWEGRDGGAGGLEIMHLEPTDLERSALGLGRGHQLWVRRRVICPRIHVFVVRNVHYLHLQLACMKAVNCTDEKQATTTRQAACASTTYPFLGCKEQVHRYGTPCASSARRRYMGERFPRIRFRRLRRVGLVDSRFQCRS